MKTAEELKTRFPELTRDLTDADCAALLDVLEPESACRVAHTFHRRLGRPATSPAALAEIPMGRLLRAQRETMSQLSNLETMMVFLPVVDGDVIPEVPLQAIARGASARIPLLIGTTLD